MVDVEKTSRQWEGGLHHGLSVVQPKVTALDYGKRGGKAETIMGYCVP